MNRAAGLATAEAGDTIIVRAANGTAMDLLITGTPVDSGTYYTIPVSVTTGTVTKGARTQVGILSPTPHGIPAGGTDGQVLTKTSGTDYAVDWETPGGGGITTEDAVDAVAGALVAGNNIDIAYNDAANTITVDVEALTVADLPAHRDTHKKTGSDPLAAGDLILDGSGVPSAGLGVAGDYYTDLAGGVLYGPKSSSGWGAAQTPTIAGAPVSTASDEIGTRWRFLRAGRITGARYQRHSTGDTTINVRVWNDGATKLVEKADIQAAVAGTFTVTFTTPLTVAANDVRTLSLGGASGGQTPYGSTPQVVTNTADVSFLELRDNTTVGTYPNNVTTSTIGYVEPIFEPSESWPVTVRTVPTSVLRRTVNAQTGTTFTPAAVDENTMVTLFNASPITVTLPSNSTASIATGTEVDFLWYGVGQPTFAAGSGATANATPGLKLRARYSAATAKKVGTNDWVIIGDLSA